MKSNPGLPSDLRFDSRLLQLDSRDNVLTVIEALSPKDHVWLDGEWVGISQPMPTGYKIAACDLPPGTQVLKYGVAIGSTTCHIRKGELVHTHNLKSDYLPTYLRETQGAYFANP